MASTRSGSTSSPSVPASETKKREATDSVDETPVKKRGRPAKKQTSPDKGSAEKKQTTIEESMDIDAKEHNEDGSNLNNKGGEKARENSEEEIDSDEKTSGNGETTKDGNDQDIVNETMEAADDIEDDSKVAEQIKDDNENPKISEEKTNGLKKGEKNAFDEVKADTDEVKKDAEEEQKSKTEAIAQNNKSIIKDAEREAAIPSSILEKGIIYFFYRPRVGVEDPQGIEDIARSFLVLRPIPLGAKIGDGPLEDSGKARLLALPKKMLPHSTRDKFLMFTDEVGLSVKDLREQFASNEYSTKTSGTRNSPAATPFAEGVYAITSTDRESHLAYHLTMPTSLGEVQKELGVHKKGSFVLSAKNPKTGGPANATIANPAEYPEELQRKFRGLNWMPLVPELLDYKGTQFLIIGEGLGEFSGAVKEMSKDQKNDKKEKPEEEIEKLEEEDHDRIANLKEDDPVFADLGLSSKEYTKMQTSW